jgi:hypothetical protein
MQDGRTRSYVEFFKIELWRIQQVGIVAQDPPRSIAAKTPGPRLIQVETETFEVSNSLAFARLTKIIIFCFGVVEDREQLR